MSHPVDTLLARLDRVRQTGADRWIARCPAHDDRSPSLSVRALPDGRVLLHDFAGCDVGDVLAALGLSLADLYPAGALADRLDSIADWRRARLQAAADYERAILAVRAAAQAEGHDGSMEDRERAALARRRLRKIDALLADRRRGVRA